jgi:ABC-type sugar transport system substrate-binding protein
MEKKIPVIVFNSGLKYANRLGLTSVLQNNFDAGIMLGQNMVNANVSKPLAVKLSTMEDVVGELRIKGIIQSMMGVVPGILEISDNASISSYTPIRSIIETYLTGGYDSIISLGGSVKYPYIFIFYF